MVVVGEAAQPCGDRDDGSGFVALAQKWQFPPAIHTVLPPTLAKPCTVSRALDSLAQRSLNINTNTALFLNLYIS